MTISWYIFLAWILGFPASTIGFLALFYLYKGSKIYGGKLGSAIKKLTISFLGLYIIILTIGVCLVLIQLEYSIPKSIYLIISILGTIISIFLLRGALAFYKSAEI